MSLDTLDEDKYAYITRIAQLETFQAGLDASFDAGAGRGHLEQACMTWGSGCPSQKSGRPQYEPNRRLTMSDFTHFKEQGRAKMVDVEKKPISQRVAVAARRLPPKIFWLLSTQWLTDRICSTARAAQTAPSDMKKNLFLTGPIGSGKSTSIANALGEYLPGAGGFLTVRQRDDTGRAVAYWLKRPDGSDGQIIIDYSAESYTMHMEVFENFGAELLEQAKHCNYVVLDEIGGFEVLCEPFMAALMQLLKSDVPCIGVMKGVGPASKMIQKLGLGDAYVQKAEQLRSWMRQDENTQLYECAQFDPEGLHLAQAWVRQYCK